MGIELLLSTSEPTNRTVAVAKRAAREIELALESERSHNDSVRLVFKRPGGKQFIVTIQSDGEIHAESFGEPRNTGEVDRAVFEALLPSATIVGSNPSWDTDLTN